jgi:hypothetical protein
VLSPVEEDPLVDLVTDEIEVVRESDLDHGFHLDTRVDGARRIAGGVQDDRPRPVRDRRLEHGSRELEPGALVGGHALRNASQHPHLRGVGDPIGSGDQHLVPLVHDRGQSHVDGLLRAGRDEDLFRLVGQPIVLLHLMAYRAA